MSTSTHPTLCSKPVFFLLIALATIIPAGLLQADAPVAPETDAPFQRGIALGLYSEDPDWSYVDMLTEMKATGASHVAIVVPWYIKTIHHNEIYRHPRFTVPMRTVRRTVRDAKRLGFEVFLFPILRVEDKSDGGWRGVLAPKDKNAFYQSYRDYILGFAKLAAKEQLPLLSVGSELASLDVDAQRWREIIRRVRKIYPGQLTYSANWDHYTAVPFFDDLDYLGVTGYFELAEEGKKPALEQLVHSWREVHAELMRWSFKHKKPLILTEVGYLSQQGTAAWPWKEGADEPLDLEIQRLCYEATRRVWAGESRLIGNYFWNWFGWGGPDSKEYTPRNKPAAQEIRKWYSTP